MTEIGYQCELCSYESRVPAGVRPDGKFIRGWDKTYFFCNHCYYWVDRTDGGYIIDIRSNESIN